MNKTVYILSVARWGKVIFLPPPINNPINLSPNNWNRNICTAISATAIFIRDVFALAFGASNKTPEAIYMDRFQPRTIVAVILLFLVLTRLVFEQRATQVAVQGTLRRYVWRVRKMILIDRDCASVRESRKCNGKSPRASSVSRSMGNDD